MRDLSCDIRFPYNWNREFYCGERLELSVELRCSKAVAVRGIDLCITCENNKTEVADVYGRDINDPDETDNECSAKRKTSTDFKTEIDILGNEVSQSVILRPGTHIFNLICWLPERINDQDGDREEQLSLIVGVRIRKLARIGEYPPPIELNHSTGYRFTNFTWPGNYSNIQNYSNVTMGISSFHVDNLEEGNNRNSNEDEHYVESYLESWLGCIKMQGEVSDDESCFADDPS